jgi:cobalt-zinc-cadmium efflux system outer membrane protein
LCAAVFLLGASAPSPSVLTLPDALTQFRKTGFDLLIADANIRAAQGDLLAANAIPNPLFGAGFSKSFDYSAADAGPGASSVGWLAQVSDQAALFNTLIVGKRRLRRNVAQAGLEAARLDRNDAERVLGLMVKQQFVEAAAAQRAVNVAQEIQATYDQSAELIQARLKAGVVSAADLARARAAAMNAAQVVDVANQTLVAARSNLSFLLGTREANPTYRVDTALFEGSTTTPLEQTTVEELLTRARALRPDLAAQRRRMEQAQASWAAARRDRVPDIQLSLQYIQIGTGQVAIQPPTLTVGVLSTIPVFYLNQGQILSAEANIRVQDLAFSRLESRVSADIESGWAAYGSARQRLSRYRTGLLEQAATARDLIRIQYEKGTSSYLEFLDAQRSFAAAQGDYIQTLSDYWNAVFFLEAAVGTEFRP